MELVPEVKRILGLFSKEQPAADPNMPDVGAEVMLSDADLNDMADDILAFEAKCRAAGTSIATLLTHVAKHFEGIDLR